MSCPVNLRALPPALCQELLTPDNVRARPMTNSLSTLSFPKSRCALWDGTPTGDKMLLHLCAHRAPRVQLTEKALRLAQRHVRHSAKTLLRCFFLGSVRVDSDEEGVTVTLDRFDPGRDQNGVRVPSAALPGDVCASCVFTSDPAALDQSEAELHQALKAVHQSISGRQTLDLAHILTLRLHVVWTQALDSTDFSLTWSCVSPATSVHVEPIRAVHVIPTALLRSLTSPARTTANSRQNGFVTMDQSRKLLLLLESDPKALSLPLVGVWFSGASHVHSPQVWAWTLRFLFSSCIQDRVLSESGTFLLLLFASTHRAPQFFQCKVNGPELDYQLLTGHHTATLYQQVACVQGNTLECELISESSSRQTEVFRRAHRTFSTSPGGVLSVVDQDSGVEDEDLSPRPSPSPHLPSAHQARRIQPSVPELSLLIDGTLSSNHDAAPAIPKAQAPPPPSHRKSSPLRFHSTPYSYLQSSCSCCKTNNYQCTSIHADGSTPGPSQLQIQHKTLINCQHSSQMLHQMQSSKHSSQPNLHQSPSNLRQSCTNQSQTGPVSQNDQMTNSHPVGSLPSLNPSQPALSPQQLAAPSFGHQTQNFTSNVQPTLQKVFPSPLNPAQNLANHNCTIEEATNPNQNQLKMLQLQPNPVLNLFHTPQNVGKMNQAIASLNTSDLPARNLDLLSLNISQSPFCPPTNQNFLPLSQHNVAAVPSFTSGSPSAMGPSCSQPVFTAPPSVACVSHCCEQQVALSSVEAYQLLLQQEGQLRLLQQQVEMLLEAQGKLQSSQKQTQTKSTTSVAVGTGASLFWPEPPPLHRGSSTSPPSTSPALRRGSSTSPPVRGSVSPSHSPRLESCDQAELGADGNTTTTKTPSSPAPSQNGLSRVDSPVLGESVSMYGPQDDHQGSFYHNLMTQLNSRLQEEDKTKQEVKESKQKTTQSKQEEKIPGRSPDHPRSQAHSSLSSHSSSEAPGQVQSPVLSLVQGPKKKKPPRASDAGGEDVVVSATLRRLRQLGVKLDKQELSESEQARAKAVESASTLACINPAAVVSRLSAPSPSVSVVPHSSASADLSLEANAIALRYLSDQQLTHLSLSGHGPKSSQRSGSKLLEQVSMSSSTDITILSPNNMSLATRKYMKRYGLIEEESEEEEEKEEEPEVKGQPACEALLPQSQLIRELKPKMQLLAGNRQNGGGRDDEDKENEPRRRRRRQAMESQGSLGNILDLSRLRQLPKLF